MAFKPPDLDITGEKIDPQRIGQTTRSDEAVEQVYEPDLGECTARRLDETAYVFWRRDRLGDARACLAAATAFRDRTPDFRDLGRAMLEVVLAPVLKSIEQAPGEGDDSAESLLVKP